MIARTKHAETLAYTASDPHKREAIIWFSDHHPYWLCGSCSFCEHKSLSQKWRDTNVQVKWVAADMHHSGVRIMHCAPTRGMWNSSPSPEPSRDFSWQVNRKNTLPFTPHLVTSIGCSHWQTRHPRTTLWNVDHAFVDGCADHGRDEDCETETFPIFASQWCFPRFPETLVRCCRGMKATEGCTTGSLHLTSPRLRCRSSSRLLQVKQRIPKATVRLLSCFKLMLLPLCCYGSAVADLHLHLLAVAFVCA